MNLIQLAIDFNANGALSLVSGQCPPKTAFGFFRKSLTTIESLCCLSEDAWYFDNLPEFSWDNKFTATAAQVPGLRQDYFFVFPLALVYQLTPSVVEVGKTNRVFSSADLAYCSTMSTYNMALTYHSVALKTGNDNTKVLQKACLLYNKCLEIIESAMSISGVEGIDNDIFVLQLVIWNNLAQTHYALGNIKSCYRSLDMVREFANKVIRSENLLKTAKDQSGRSNDNKNGFRSIVTEYLDEILLNTLVPATPLLAPSA